MKKIAYFYLPEGTLNDATIYYTELIKRAFKENGFVIEVRNTLFKENIDSYIVAITPGDAYQIKKKNPKCKLFTWFQGIGPEEYVMLYGTTIKSFFVKRLSEFWEKQALKKSEVSIFVSDAMLRHYNKKYNVAVKKYLVIPCYNKGLNEELISENTAKYKNMSFVYAGSLYQWQCVDKVLQIFKEIENLNPSAQLMLLTKDVEEAKNMANSYRINNFNVKYIALEKLDEELVKYKYGFLLREKDLVNYVATPTKMNSYLSVGIIPVYSNVVDSFRKNLNLENYQVIVEAEDSNQLIAKKIFDQNKQLIDVDNFLIQLKDVFSAYFNDKIYIELIKNVLNN